MPKLEVQQKCISILVQFVKYVNFFSIIVLRSGRVLLYVTVTGKSSVLDVLILFSNFFLGTELAPSICVVVSILL